jgi:hypothetical protein
MPEDEVVEYDITGVLDQSGKWEFIWHIRDFSG